MARRRSPHSSSWLTEDPRPRRTSCGAWTFSFGPRAALPSSTWTTEVGGSPAIRLFFHTFVNLATLPFSPSLLVPFTHSFLHSRMPLFCRRQVHLTCRPVHFLCPGSSGHGRAYRQALVDSQGWGVVDLDDVCAGAKFLVDQGKVDGERLCITGGSAGGYTTLMALTTRSVFKAGCSKYGIGDINLLAAHTHKFESRCGPVPSFFMNSPHLPISPSPHLSISIFPQLSSAQHLHSPASLTSSHIYRISHAWCTINTQISRPAHGPSPRSQGGVSGPVACEPHAGPQLPRAPPPGTQGQGRSSGTGEHNTAVVL